MHAVNTPAFQQDRGQSPHTVSVLDLEQYRLSGVEPPGHPIRGTPDDTDVSLSQRCQSSSTQDDQTHQKVPLMIMCGHGGAYRDRTDDLLNANQALSQLS